MRRRGRRVGHAAACGPRRTRRRMLGLMVLGLLVASVSCARPGQSDRDPALAYRPEPITAESSSAAAPAASTGSIPLGLVAAGSRADSATDPAGRSSGAATVVAGDAVTVEELLQHGLYIAGASPAHLAIRGTPAAASVRCAWRGIARTAQQRENAIRFWLQISPPAPIPDVRVAEALFTLVLDTLAPEFRETAKANFLAIARGGLSMDYVFLTCFADTAVTHYLLGTGTTPAPVTVAYDRRGGAEAADYSGVPASVTFGPAATATSFQLIPVDDTLDDDGESLQLGFGDLPAGVTVGGVAMTTVTIQDDDEPPVVPGVRLSTERLTLVEGASAQVTVRLTTRPISRVQVQFRTQAGADVRMDPVDLYFIWSTWDQPQAVTITALADEEAEGAETHKVNAWVVDAIDPNYIGLGKTTVWTTVTDAETPTALARPPPPYIQSASVAATTVTLTLSAPPAGVAQWRIESRVGADAAWTLAADVSAAGSADYAFTGAAGTTYEFRARASGDGTTYAAEWSDPSNVVTATIAAES